MARDTKYEGVTPEESVMMQRAANCKRAMDLGKKGFEVCKSILRSLRDNKEKYSNGEGITVSWNKNPSYSVDKQALVDKIGSENYEQFFTQTITKDLLTKGHLDTMVKAGVISEEDAKEVTSVTHGERKFVLNDGREISMSDLEETMAFLSSFSEEELGIG